MPLRLFIPTTKVQKDRAVMRETDARMAKYSRRGILLNLGAYLLCAGTGQMHLTAPRLTVVLTAAIVLLTLVRGYFAFRFDAVYPRAPSRWRDQYFVFTFLGAICWSAIVVSFTLTLGMTHEVPLLWLYTIVFFSTMTHAFAPFKNFCLYYQFVALFPPSLAAIYVGGFDGYMHALVMLLFLTLLSYQTAQISHNYWERLHANFTLKQKTKTLEAEKRDNEANIELNHEFINNLGHELRTSLNDVMGSLELIKLQSMPQEQVDLLQIAERSALRQLDMINNVLDFSRIVNHQLALDNMTFNIRQQLESWVRSCANEAHQHGINLDYQFKGDAPNRIRGDCVRLGQVMSLIISNSVRQSGSDILYIEARSEHLTDKQIQLQIHLSSRLRNELVDSVPQVVDDVATDSRYAGPLWFTLCKGITECMGGEFIYAPVDGGQRRECWLQIPFDLVDGQNASLDIDERFADTRVAVFSADAIELGHLHKELSSWCGEVNNIGRLSEIESALGATADLMPAAIIYSSRHSDIHDILSYIDNVQRQHPDSPLLHILFATHMECQSDGVKALLAAAAHIKVIRRPYLAQEFHDQLRRMLFEQGSPAPVQQKPAVETNGKTVMVVDDHRVNQMITQGMLAKLGYGVVVANNGVEALQLFESCRADLILMDCQMPDMDGYEATRQLRAKEESLHLIHTPIVAMTAQVEADSESQCLASGMDDYLAKPVSLETLESRLKRWIS